MHFGITFQVTINIGKNKNYEGGWIDKQVMISVGKEVMGEGGRRTMTLSCSNSPL